jgi:hypothetical protein
VPRSCKGIHSRVAAWWREAFTSRRKRLCLGTPDLLEPRQVLAVTAQTEFVLANRYTPGAQSNSTLAYEDNGNLIVVWQDSELDSSGRGVYARKFTPAGAPVADQYRINATTAGDQQLPQIERVGSGFAVLWTDVNSTQRLLVRRLNSGGAPTGSEIDVTGSFSNDKVPADPRLFSLTDGGFLVLWGENPGNGMGRLVHGRRFDSTNTQTGSFSFQVAPEIGGIFERFATVAGPSFPELGFEQTSDGTFLVYWNKISDTFVPDVGQRYGSQVQVQRFSTAGTKIGGVATLLDFTLSDDSDVQRVTPLFTALPDGDFLMQWHAPADFAWVARRFNGGFVAQGADTTLIDATESVAGFLIGAARSRVLSNGDVIVAWHQSVSFNNDNTRIRLFSSALAPKSSVITVTTSLERANFPVVVPDGNRGFAVTIAEVPNPVSGAGGSETYFRRYATDDAPENRAPVMLAGSNPFYVAPVGKRLTPELTNGVLVSDLLASGVNGMTFNDPDAGALRGVAIYQAVTGFGVWQYTSVASPAESDWINLETGGAPSLESAILLAADATTRVRLGSTLIPHHEGNEESGFLPLGREVRSAIEFVAWDRSAGTNGGRANINDRGGISPFSTDTQELDLYFEARLWRSFNKNAQLNVYTLEAEFFALVASPAYEDRSTSAWTGFTVFLSPLPSIPTVPLFRMYFGVQYNDNGTETDMGYRYLTSNIAEASILEGLGREDLRDLRQGAYFREEGVNFGSGIIGHIASMPGSGRTEMSQIYRTDLQNKPTRPGGTPEGSTPTSQVLQEQGDHVYTTNKPFEKSKPGTWREESSRGFVRELSPGLVAGAAPPAPPPIMLSGTVASQTASESDWVDRDAISSAVTSLVAIASPNASDFPTRTVEHREGLEAAEASPLPSRIPSESSTPREALDAVFAESTGPSLC